MRRAGNICFCGSIFQTHKKTFQYALAVKQIAIVQVSFLLFIYVMVVVITRRTHFEALTAIRLTLLFNITITTLHSISKWKNVNRKLPYPKINNEYKETMLKISRNHLSVTLSVNNSTVAHSNFFNIGTVTIFSRLTNSIHAHIAIIR